MSDGGTEAERPVVVIGCGNEMRSDDGVGPRVARTVAGWHLPHVRALAVQQLLPELVECFADAAAVVFIDACCGADLGTLRTDTLQPDRNATRPGHVSDPRWLLALARDLYGQVPPARLVTIRAGNLDYGLELSPAAAQGLEEALGYLASLLTRPRGGCCPDRTCR